MRRAKVYCAGRMAGVLREDDEGYTFVYAEAYLRWPEAVAISLTMPLADSAYRSNVLFPFFDGLIPEGWLLDVAQRNWKINRLDRMGLLLACCRDCSLARQS